MIRPRGFSLVELMVAMTLALIVSAGVMSVFIGSRSAYQSTTGTASTTDGGRFALNFIQNSVRSAGFMACANAQNMVATPMLNAGTTPLYFSFGLGLGGFEASNTGTAGSFTVAEPPVAPDASSGDWVSGLDLALTGLVVKNNDVLVVRSTQRNAQPEFVSAITDGAAQFTVNAQGSLAAGQLAVIADCLKFVPFQISSVSGSSPNVTITHAAGGSPGNASAALPASFSIGAQVTPVDTVVYYVGKGADGDGALFAYDLNATNTFTATELVPDIEAMQILYGLDTTQTQTVSAYVTADQVPILAPGGFNSVMSVKVAVLAASAQGALPKPTAAPTYNLLGNIVTAPIDTRSRQVFEMTIGLRNSLP
jgi:type IV pilus assembly protein PilW